MNILHIASIDNDLCNGVSIVAPEHIFYQSKHATIGFINIKNIKIDCGVAQYKYCGSSSIQNLHTPFNKPDLVVFHEVYIFEYISLYKWLIKNSIPYVIIPHGEITNEALKKKKLKKMLANLVFFNSFLKNAAEIQYLSFHEASRSSFKKIPFFVGTNGIKKPSITKTSFDCGVSFLYIGRLDAYHKGLDLLIESVSRVKDLFVKNQATLNIYGPDYQGRFEYVKKLIEDNCVSDIVFLHDKIVGKEKEEKLLNSSIFIQTSRFEGMPMGILESLSYGIPVAVTEGTTLGKIVKEYDCGWSSETSIESISEMLSRIFNEYNKNDCLLTKSKNALKMIDENFDWDLVARETVDNYLRIVNIYKNV